MTGETIFHGTAWYYARYRPGYPQELFDLLRGRFELDGTGRLLDLGCGTGKLAVPLAPLFEEVVAIDVDAGMLAELNAVAPANLRTVHGRAEDVVAPPGAFRLATIGRAFHWMDRRVLLARLDRIAAGLALVGDGQPAEGELPWWDAVQEVVREFLGPRRRAGTQGYFSHSGELWTELLADSPFGAPEEHEIVLEREWDVERVVGLLHSTSFASPPLLGDRMAEFDDTVRARLAGFEQPLRERVFVEVLLCLRPARDWAGRR